MLKSKVSKILITIGLTLCLISSTLTGTFGYEYVSCYVESQEDIDYPNQGELTEDYQEITARIYSAEKEGYREYFLLSEKISAGELDFTPEELESLNLYFIARYSIVQANATYSYGLADNSEIVYIKTPETYEARIETVSEIIKAIGLEEDENAYMSVIKTSQRIRKALSYNHDYIYATTIEALNDGQAVCVHYAICMNIIMNAQGIPCRTVCGHWKTSDHIWNQVWIDGRWLNVDVCNWNFGFALNSSNYNEITF